MRATGLILALAVLAFAPMASAQSEAPQAPEASAPADVSAPADPSVPADATEATDSESAAQAVAPEPELICRTLTARTESRLRSARTRVCRTQAQWDEADAQARGGRNNAASNNN